MLLCAVSQEIAEALGSLSSDSSEEEVLTTRVVRRRVIIQVGGTPGSWAKSLATFKEISRGRGPSDRFRDRLSVSDGLLWLQADSLPELPPQSVTEEAYTDQHGNLVVKKVRGRPEESRRWESRPFRASVVSTRSHGR